MEEEVKRWIGHFRASAECLRQEEAKGEHRGAQRFFAGAAYAYDSAANALETAARSYNCRKDNHGLEDPEYEEDEEEELPGPYPPGSCLAVRDEATP